MRLQKDKKIFDFCYINPIRVDSFFSQVNGHLVNEKKERTEKGLTGKGELGVEIGDILAKLGLFKAQAKSELNSDYSKTLEVTTSLSFENKLDLVLLYFSQSNRVGKIDLSTEVDFPKLTQIAKTTDIQRISGNFLLKLEKSSSKDVKEILGRVQSQSFKMYYGREIQNSETAKFTLATMVSTQKQPKNNRSVIQVPIYLEYLLPNQAFTHYVSLSKEVELLVMGKSLIEQTHLVVNPIAFMMEV